MHVVLRSALPAPDGASINATVAFGGIEILVPKGWRISLRTTPIFGGVDDKTDHSVAPAEHAPVLHVDAVCLFGGIDINSAGMTIVQSRDEVVIARDGAAGGRRIYIDRPMPALARRCGCGRDREGCVRA